MKKLLGAILILVTLISGCSNKKMNVLTPIPLRQDYDYGKLTTAEEQAKPKLHYIGKSGWFGDAHPVYKDGKWYVYFLELPFTTTNRATLQGVRQGLVVSEDLINWEPVKATIDFPRDWWAVANTVKDGKLYSMFNDVVGNRGYGVSTSEDYINFTEIGVAFPYSSVPSSDPRDPSLFYNDKTKEYWFLFSAKQQPKLYPANSSEIFYAATTDFETFSPAKSLFNPGNANVPECPELFKMGDNYYLIASWGTKRVGQPRYRIADQPEGPFRRFPIDTLTSSEMMAPNSAEGDDKRVMIGWIPTYVGSMDNAPYQWGGHMAFPQEIYQGKNEMLYTRPAFENELIRKDYIYRFNGNADYIRGNGFESDGNTLHYKKGSDYGELWFTGEYESFDLEMKITLGKDNAGTGIVFRTGNEGFAGYEVYLDRATNSMILREHFERLDKITSVPVELKTDDEMELRIICDGNIIEVYLDQKYSLSARVHKFTTVNKVGIFSEFGEFTAKDINIYSLKGQ